MDELEYTFTPEEIGTLIHNMVSDSILESTPPFEYCIGDADIDCITKDIEADITRMEIKKKSILKTRTEYIHTCGYSWFDFEHFEKLIPEDFNMNSNTDLMCTFMDEYLSKQIVEHISPDNLELVKETKSKLSKVLHTLMTEYSLKNAYEYESFTPNLHKFYNNVIKDSKELPYITVYKQSKLIINSSLDYYPQSTGNPAGFIDPNPSRTWEEDCPRGIDLYDITKGIFMVKSNKFETGYNDTFIELKEWSITEDTVTLIAIYDYCS